MGGEPGGAQEAGTRDARWEGLVARFIINLATRVGMVVVGVVGLVGRAYM